MRTVVLISRKGGSGKTTLATTLAAALAEGGWKVALADADPQKSALRWLKRRPGTSRAIAGLDWTGHDRTQAGFDRAPRGIDWLIVDTPAGALAEPLIAEAHHVLIPVQAGVFDTDSTARFLRDLARLKRVRKGKAQIGLVGNRLHPGARAAARMAAFFVKAGQDPAALLAERAAYADLAERGQAIFDCPPGRYRAMRAQWDGIITTLV